MTIIGSKGAELKDDGLVSTETLEEQIEDARELLRMFIDNRFSEVYPRLMERQQSSLIHALGVGALRFLEALLTLDKQNLEAAVETLRFSSQYADRYRKKSYSSYLFGANYDHFTDLECVAELCYAKSALLSGVVTVLVDQTVYGFINGALSIRSAHQSFKECLNMLKSRQQWESLKVRMHFESGTRLGIGGFDLAISFFPSKLAKILEFIGFCGDRNVALDELSQSVALVDGLLYDVSSILLSTYHGFLEYFYGLGEGDVAFFDISAKIWLARTPNSAIVKLGLGLREQITGSPDAAISYYLCCIEGQKDWIQLHYACYWMVMWCHVLKSEWKSAVKYANLLRNECKWSPAMFSYLYAVFMFMEMETSGKLQLKEEVSNTLRILPQLKRRLGGKRAFHEKLVIDRSKKFHNRVEQFLLPHLELMYIWNYFNMANGLATLLQPFIDQIDAKMSLHINDKEKSNANLDRYCYLTFMKSVCQRHLGHTHEALKGFEEVLSCKKRIHDEIHLLPQSCLEMGLIYRKMGKVVESKKLLKKARGDYSGYLTETMIHFRVQTALDALRH